MINTHFKNSLTSLGYLDMELAYSLGYCQGDGMAWYGELSRESLAILIPRLLGELTSDNEVEKMLGVLRDYRRYEKIEITRNCHRYCHENTMTLDSTVEFRGLIDEDDEQAMSAADVTPELLARWDELWELFISKLQQDMRAVSLKLRDEGYALIEAMSRENESVWKFATENFTVELHEQVIDFSDLAVEFAWLEEDVQSSTIQAMLRGEQRCVNLKLEVKSSSQDWPMGSATAFCQFVEPNDRTYGGIRRQLAQEAIAEARQGISEIMSAFNSIKAA